MTDISADALTLLGIEQGIRDAAPKIRRLVGQTSPEFFVCVAFDASGAYEISRQSVGAFWPDAVAVFRVRGGRIGEEDLAERIGAWLDDLYAREEER